MSDTNDRLEQQLAAWRDTIGHETEAGENEASGLEAGLRAEIATLSNAGLSIEEAFLVAVRRLAETSGPTRRFMNEHAGTLLHQSLAISTEHEKSTSRLRNETLVVLGLAAVAAIAVKLPDLLGYALFGSGNSFYARNLSFFVLPLLAVYFGWKRGLDRSHGAWIAASFVAAGVIVNVFPFVSGGATEGLTALHLPIALWLAIGVAYTGGRWNSSDHRMNFVRFSGELFVYYVLIALGGGLLTLLTGFLFGAIGVDIESFLGEWLLPCGAAGGFIIASWLVETKRSVMENMAPVLTRLFTPLFAVAMLAFLVAMVVTGNGINIERNVLIGFDLLLVVVLGLSLYTISSRDLEARAGVFDGLQLVLLVSALLVDLLALAAIAGRISEFGFSANKTAALGLNLIILVNLAWSAWLSVGFLRGRRRFDTLERWQTSYLPVYAAWAAIVVIAFPAVFGFN